jgi:magnesium transporter
MDPPVSSHGEAITALRIEPDGTVDRLTRDRFEHELGLRADVQGLTWVSARDPDPETARRLAERFGLHPLALEDLLKRSQRPKIDTYDEQHLVVAYEAVADGVPALAEHHFYAGPGWLLSVQWSASPLVDAVRDRFERGGSGTPRTIGELLYLLLDAVVDSYFPELDRVSDRIDRVEDRVVEGEDDRSTLGEILTLKRRLLELRRVLAPMRDVANALLRRDVVIVEATAVPYYQDLYDHLVRVLDQLDVYRELLAAVLDARMTVASNALNSVMKRLTAFTVVLMVPTLIAGIYGMNFVVMPELRWALGYPFALLLMAVAVIAAITLFRRNHWF